MKIPKNYEKLFGPLDCQEGMTRGQAQKMRQKYYWPSHGFACESGHHAPRITVSGNCVECHRRRARQNVWRKKGMSEEEIEMRESEWQAYLFNMEVMEKKQEADEKKRMELYPLKMEELAMECPGYDLVSEELSELAHLYCMGRLELSAFKEAYLSSKVD